MTLQANPWPSVQMTMSKRCVNVSRHSMLRQVQLLIITSPRDSGEVSTQPSLLPSFGKICGPYLENRLDEPGLICRQLQFQFWTILLFALQWQLNHSSCHRIFRIQSSWWYQFWNINMNLPSSGFLALRFLRLPFLVVQLFPVWTPCCSMFSSLVLSITNIDPPIFFSNHRTSEVTWCWKYSSMSEYGTKDSWSR